MAHSLLYCANERLCLFTPSHLEREYRHLMWPVSNTVSQKCLDPVFLRERQNALCCAFCSCGPGILKKTEDCTLRAHNWIAHISERIVTAPCHSWSPKWRTQTGECCKVQMVDSLSVLFFFYFFSEDITLQNLQGMK